MNERQRLVEHIRQQSIQKRAQALREAARNQANNAPIAAAGASSSGGGRRPTPIPPVDRPFIIRVDSTLGNGLDSFVLKTNSSYSYNYDVTWTEVGSPANTGTLTGQTGDATISFPSPGQYDLRVSGQFPAIQMGGKSTDAPKVTGIIQWGTGEWASMSFAFGGCVNLSLYLATDQPDLSGVTTMNTMFFGASSFNGDISDWDTSQVTNMFAMFSGASSFNGDISEWDTSNVTVMSDMFAGATSFNRDLSGWCVSLIPSAPPGFDGGATSWVLPKPVWGTCP